MKKQDNILIILYNLGTPRSTSVIDIRNYLKDFLSDPYMKKQTLLWKILLNTFILNKATKKAVKIYSKLWTPEGLPLLFHTKHLSEALEKQLNNKNQERNFTVRYIMRFGEESITQTMEKISAKEFNELLIIPLFPQYSKATTGSILASIAEELKGNKKIFKGLNPIIIPQFASQLDYITALKKQVLKYTHTDSKTALLISFHSLPLSFVKSGDPYSTHCEDTFFTLKTALERNFSIIEKCFQSKIGFSKWLEPDINYVLKDLAKNGTKDCAVIAPSFLVDCSETLVDIDIEARETFLKHGGTNFTYIPCLNAENFWIEHFSDLINKQLTLVQKN